jgi:hypothetical protein
LGKSLQVCVELELRIRKVVCNKIKDVWPETGLYLKNTKRNGKVGWEKK